MYDQPFSTQSNQADNLSDVQTNNEASSEARENARENDRFLDIYNEMFAELGRMRQELKDLDDRRPKLVTRIQRLAAALQEMTRPVAEERVTRPYTRRNAPDAPVQQRKKRQVTLRKPEENFYSESVMQEIANIIDDNGSPVRAEVIYNTLIKKNLIEPVDSTQPIRIFAIRLAKCTQDLFTYNRNTKEWGTPDMFSASGRRERARKTAVETGGRFVSFRPENEDGENDSDLATGADNEPTIGATPTAALAESSSDNGNTSAGIPGLYEIRRSHQ